MSSAAIVLCASLGFVLVLGSALLYMVFRKYLRIIVRLMEDRAPECESGTHPNGISRSDRRELIRFEAEDGQALYGFFASSEQSRQVRQSRGVVVFAHEFGSNAESCFRYCKPLIEGGFDVFSFDFRGHGHSPSQSGYKPMQWPTDREKSDMAAAIGFVLDHLERLGLPRRVGVFGMSRGAGVAILASGECPEVAAVMTDGLFSTDTTIEYLIRRFATVFARIRFVARNHPPLTWRILRWLLLRECSRRFDCKFLSVRRGLAKLGHRPLLMIHGASDSFIRASQAHELARRAQCLVELCIVPGAKHNCSVFEDPILYALKIESLFAEHLAAAAQEPVPAAIIRRGPSIPSQHSTPAPAYAPVYSPSVTDRPR